MKDFWNSRYSHAEYAYGQQPNEFWAQWLDGKKPGTVLLPAEGEGRNAVFAAQKGWDVWAFDQSVAGQKKALALAAEVGIKLQDFSVAKAQIYQPPVKPEVIGLFYAHLPTSLRPAFHAKCVQWLTPGGYLVLEAFSTKQLGLGSGGPKAAEMLMSAAQLRTEFKGLEVLEAEELPVELKEGIYHKGPAEVVRFVARKPR